MDSGSDWGGTDRYRVRRTLGVGGMGVVHEVWDRQRQQHVALKTLRKIDPAGLYRFKREFRALADVAHPNLVSLHELVAEGDQLFFTMELVPGVDFLRWVGHATWPGADTESGAPSVRDPLGAAAPLPPPDDATASPAVVQPQDPTPDPASFLEGDPDRTAPRVLRERVRLGGDEAAHIDHERLRQALRQVAEGVATLHGLGMLHRDIKPSNVLVTTAGRAVLLDLGLVTMIAPGEASVERYVAGTGAYMSPEQAAARPLTEASDWYSVGVMLYEALTGVRPFRGGFDEVVRAKQFAEPPAPSRVRRGVPTDLDSLCVDLLRLRPDERPPASEVLRRLGAAPSSSALRAGDRAGSPGGPVFVGRERPLGTLRSAFQVAAGGGSIAVHLHGDSGLGKSALLRRFVDELASDPSAVVLMGRCYERESMPYKAIDSIIDSLSRFLRTLPPPRVDALLPRDVHALARVFPVLRQVEAIALAPGRGLDGADPQQLRQRAFAALREFLARIADRHALVVAIDDLQWGDLDSVQLLLALTEATEAPPMLLLLAYRSVEPGERGFLAVLRRAHGLRVEAADLPRALAVPQGHVVDLPLTPLPPDDAVRLARALVGDDEGAVRAVAAESRGSPFFVQELARYLHSKADRAGEDSGSGWLEGRVDTDVLDLSSGEWAGARVDEGVKLRLDEVLRERVEGLPDAARALLETVAVAGRPLPRAVARQAADLVGSESELLTLLRQTHLVRSRGTGEDSAIEPYHDRIREAVLAAMPTWRLRDRHLRLALALEGGRQADPEALTEHFCGAGHLPRAGTYAAQAAAQAAEALAFDRAAMLYRLALRLRPEAPVEEGRRVRTALAEALANAGRGVEAAEAYREAAAASSGSEALELRRLAAEHLLRAGHFEEGMAALRLVLAEVDMRIPATPRAALLSLLARRTRVRFRGTHWVERSAAEVPALERFRVDLCWSVAVGLAMIDPIRGSDFQARSLVLALDLGEPRRVARALAMEGAYSAVASGEGGVRRAFHLLERSLDLADRLADPMAEALARSSRGVVLYEQGRWAEARADLEAAEALLVERCTGVSWELSTTRHFLCLTLEMMGDLTELARRVPEYVRDAEARGDRFTATSFRSGNLNLAWLLHGDPAGARAAWRTAMAPWWDSRDYLLQHYEGLYAQVGIDLFVGDGGSAWMRVDDAWPALRRSGLLFIQQLKLEALFLRGRAALAAALRPDPAVGPGVDRDPELLVQDPDELLPERAWLLTQARKAAGRMERERMAWAHPLAALLRAAVSAAQGDRALALETLRAASAALRAVSMPALAAAADARRADLGATDEAALRGLEELRERGASDPRRLLDLWIPLLDDGARAGLGGLT